MQLLDENKFDIKVEKCEDARSDSKRLHYSYIKIMYFI